MMLILIFRMILVVVVVLSSFWVMVRFLLIGIVELFYMCDWNKGLLFLFMCCVEIVSKGWI